MNRGINLLKKRQNYKHKEKIFQVFRTVTVVIGGVGVAALIVAFYLKTTAQLKNRAFLTKKEDYLTELLTKKDIEKKIAYFSEKGKAFDQLLKTDVNFMPRYRLLQAHLPMATAEAALTDVTYDANHDITFKLAFGNYGDFYNALPKFQDERFLSLFEKLTQESFAVEIGGAGGSYQIGFSGKLKPVDL